jgi:signal transduction histidine kinase
VSEPGARPLILYVDDEEGNRIVFEHAAGAEFNVRTVDSGAAALAVLAAEEVGVLVTDMRMPGMRGDELLVRVKERHPSTIRAVITAYSDLDPILRAINEGLVARYVVKPWNRDELRAVLRWGVEAYLAGRESAALQQRLLEVERLATLGGISATVLHDVRGPLGLMLLDSRQLAAHFEPGSVVLRALAGEPMTPAEAIELAHCRDELRELAADLVRNAGQANGVTDVLLGFLRRTPAEPGAGATAPLDAVRNALAICARTAHDAEATITYDGPATLPPITLSGVELTQVMVNLVTNAAQALRDGGKAGGAIIVRARVTATHVVLEVVDDGVGMTPEVLARVGRKFFSTRPERTGIGLAQCHRLVGKVEGAVELASEAGVGTTVTVSLPRAQR